MTEPSAACADDSLMPAAVSRRTAPRFECRHVTFYKPVGNRCREVELATVHDISVSGIGLLVRERIQPGSILAIELNSTVRQVHHQFLARVTHTTDRGDGYILIGCEFATRLSETELQAILR